MNADGIKLTSYFGERHRANGTFVANALVDLYSRNDIAASIVLRGIQGFGLKHHLRTDRSLSLSEDLPMTAIAVDTRPNIEAVLDQTLELNLPGLVTLEQARLLSGEIEPDRDRGEHRRINQADGVFRAPRSRLRGPCFRGDLRTAVPP